MESPPGYEREGTVWLLRKGLYGLKQTGRIWNEKLNTYMEELGFVQCQRDHTVFRIGDWRSPDWAIFWVDDETGVGSRQQLARVASMFGRKHAISGEGEMGWTLRIGVARDRDTHTISLLQEDYIDNLVERFEPQNATTVATPLEPGAILTKDQCPNDTRRAARYVRQQIRGTDRLLTVRCTRYATKHRFRHHQTSLITGQPNTDAFRRSLMRLALPQGKEEMDPQSRRGHRGYSRAHRLRLGRRPRR